MKKTFFIAALFAVSCAVTEASAQTTGGGTTGNNNHDGDFHRPNRCYKLTTTPQVSYNCASTVLNVSFPGNGQGGKVEIYRNGAKVVCVVAPAGASLSYVLRNYGKGNYTIVVSCGKTVVYSNSVTLK